MDSHYASSQTTPSLWDAVVVGSGPAGAATAITLARQGRQVLLIEKQSALDFKLGESLPPAALGIIKQLLGPIERLDMYAEGMRKTSGNISSWDSVSTQTNDFFFTPAGFGLCIDRARFDQALRDQACADGALLSRKTQFVEAKQDSSSRDGNWQIKLSRQAGYQTIHSKYLVDASGRNSVVAKALKVSKSTHDNLFAYAQRFRTQDDQDNDRYTRLEASPQGWWYSNRLPSEEKGSCERLVVFHTDKDLTQAKQAASNDGFADLLSDAPHVSELLIKFGYNPIGKIRGAAAGSEHLDRFSGKRWLAVGDAAQAYDPLSSQGMFKALSTGIHAGQMIDYALQARSTSTESQQSHQYLQRFEHDQQQRWVSYLQQLKFYYQSQPRWPNQPFWSRRAQVNAMPSEFKLLREAS